jgi:hypothetical protein
MPKQRAPHLLIAPYLGYPRGQNQTQKDQGGRPKARLGGHGRTWALIRRPLLLNYSMFKHLPRGMDASEPLLPLFFAWD